MNIREEMLKWAEPKIKAIENLSKECPEFLKLYRLWTDAHQLFYDLMFPVGIYDDGLYGYLKTFHPFHHYWYDDGEMCIAHIEFEYDYFGKKVSTDTENLVLPFSAWDANSEDGLKRVKKYLLQHRSGWSIQVKSVKAASFTPDWIDFLVDTMMPLYLNMSGLDNMTYLNRRKEFDSMMSNRIVQKHNEWKERTNG